MNLRPKTRAKLQTLLGVATVEIEMKLATFAVGLSFACLPIATTMVSAQSEIVTPVVGAQQFTDAAASLNMFELQSSQLVLNRSQNEEVIALARQTIADHTAAGGAMMAAAQQVGVAPSPIVLEQHQTMIDELASVEDVQIDRAYIDAQVAAHEEAIALFERYSTNGEEGAMKTFARDTLPVFQQHQTLVSAFTGSQLRAAL